MLIHKCFNGDSNEQSFELIKSLNWIIPFLLGILSALLLDFIRTYRKRRKLKSLTLNFLKNNVMPDIKELAEEYKKVKVIIQNIVSERTSIKAFEGLSIENLQAAETTEYYNIFGKNYFLFNEIKSTLKFLIENLPFPLIQDYYNIVNEHLKEKNKVGDLEHVKTCLFCKDERLSVEHSVDLRLEEIEKLKDKIGKLLTKYSA